MKNVKKYKAFSPPFLITNTVGNSLTSNLSTKRRLIYLRGEKPKILSVLSTRKNFALYLKSSESDLNSVGVAGFFENKITISEPELALNQ
jgi:hypothetical protein